MRNVWIYLGGLVLDSTRFDDLTRLLGTGANRRKVLRGLLGGAGALAMTGATHRFAGAQPVECDTPADCGAQPDSCTEWLCVEGTCTLNGGCPVGELCCPAQGGSCAECCNDGDCPAGAPICYNPGDPTNAFCVECVDDGDCGPCESCESNTCVAYAEYCEATDSCYTPSTGGCCTTSDCDTCETCSGGACKAITNCCVDDTDCEKCSSCQSGTCVP